MVWLRGVNVKSARIISKNSPLPNLLAGSEYCVAGTLVTTDRAKEMGGIWVRLPSRSPVNLAHLHQKTHMNLINLSFFPQQDGLARGFKCAKHSCRKLFLSASMEKLGWSSKVTSWWDKLHYNNSTLLFAITLTIKTRDKKKEPGKFNS